MRKVQSTADRLDLLLDWLNDDDWERSARPWRAELPGRLSDFLASFDGSEGAGYVRVEELPPLSTEEIAEGIWATNRLPRPAGTEGIDQNEVLHTVLVDILQRGFPGAKPLLPTLFDLPALHFGIERLAPPTGKAKALRLFEKRGGAYVLKVAGERFSLIAWLVMHLLTLPGAIRLRRCNAPRPHSAERCGRFFTIPSEKGHPREFCTDRCRQRAFWERDEGQARRKRQRRRRRK